MWETPRRMLPPSGKAVVCITVDGDVAWLKRLSGDQWLQSDAQDRDCGNLQPEPVAWIHAPRLPEIRADLPRQEVDLDWRHMFPHLGGKSPGEKLAGIVAAVDKLRSVSSAGREAIIRSWCRRAGITISAEPCFYVGETE